MTHEMPLVDKHDDGIRPAGSPVHCFYCGQKVGEHHKPECVVVQKRIKIKVTVELEIMAPHSHGKHEIEFRYNESSWCAMNLPGLIETHQELTGNMCLCGLTKVEYLETVDETPVREIREPRMNPARDN